MYNVQQIKDGLINLIGWRQNVDPSGVQLTNLLQSETGLYYNDVHPLLTFENLISIARLNESGQNFTDWLKEKTEAGILKALNNWQGEKMKNRTSKNLLANSLLFPFSIDQSTFDIEKGDIVGIELIPNRSKSLVVRLRKLGIQLSENQEITIQLYKNGSAFSEKSVVVDYIGNGSVQWMDVDWELKGDNIYHIAYDQNDLLGQSVNSVYAYNYGHRGQINFPTEKYYQASAFATIGTFKNATYTASTNYGINLDLDVRCDYTTFIIEQKDLFKEIIWYQVGMDLLRELAFNPHTRINRNESNIDYNSIIYEIDGDSQGRNTNTLSGRFFSALNSIQFDETNIDKVCLPCKRRGIKYKSIGPR